MLNYDIFDFTGKAVRKVNDLVSSKTLFSTAQSLCFLTFAPQIKVTDQVTIHLVFLIGEWQVNCL